MKRISVIGLGAGGHAKVVMDILRDSKKYAVAGFMDQDSSLLGKRFCGAPVLGTDQLLEGLARKGIKHFFVGLGSVGNVQARKRLYERALQAGLAPISAVHAKAVISREAQLGKGLTVMAGAVINPGARLGENVIVNTAAVVEHDCVLEDHVHIATGALLAGGVTVKAEAHVGLGAAVKQGVTIGRGAIIGAGAVVVKDVPDQVVVVGIPARILKSR